MPSRRPRPRRLLLPMLLAAVLVGEITGIALARTLVPAASSATSSDAAVAAAPDATTAGAAPLTRAPEFVADAARDTVATSANAARVRTSAAAVGPAALPISPARSTTSASAASSKSFAPAKGTTKASSSASYHGRNHVWIPSLGINRSVSSFPCSRTRPPDNHIYRWGCAGRNNVYLMGHAYSVFKPLHDAYVGGRLKKGMKVIYADGAGRVHTYAVIWWRVVKPTTAASWAWAAQSRPSMTLQTCVGARSDQRLMVRLVQVA